MKVGSTNITLSNKYLNKFFHFFDKSVNSLIQKLTPEISKLVDSGINQLNNMVAHQTENTWDLSLLSKNYPINMTQTTAPSLVKDSHLIKLNFDGNFHKP